MLASAFDNGQKIRSTFNATSQVMMQPEGFTYAKGLASKQEDMHVSQRLRAM